MEVSAENLEVGPLVEETMLSSGLDYYKLTMSQLQYEKHPEEDVTFSFTNRGGQRISKYVSPQELKARLDFIRSRGWSNIELDYIRSVQDPSGNNIFTDEYVNFLRESQLPEVQVTVNEETNDLDIETTGKWPLVTYWETIVMSEVSELYFANYMRANNIDPIDVYAEGEQRFDQKVSYLQDHPDVKIAEFGTRRRFSLRWQKEVLRRLQVECPENLVGTSNVTFANTEHLNPIGTFAHELPMVYAGLADHYGYDIRASHSRVLQDWQARYPSLSIALSDTFGSDFFFQEFSDQQMRDWKGTRHDSGDPLVYGEKAIKQYVAAGIDPTTKMIMFSDNLKLSEDANTLEPIRSRFAGRVATGFGVGTNLTNDLGFDALNQVMKATAVNGTPTVKLSDDDGKHTGPKDKVYQYEEIFHGAIVTTR